MSHRFRLGDRASALRSRSSKSVTSFFVRGHYLWVAREASILKNPKTGLVIPGRVKWEDENHNLVVNQGLNSILGVFFSADTQITSWFLALLKTAAGSPAASSTYQNFMGTANQEVTDYDEATRPAWTEGGASGQSISNSASPAVITCNANATVFGGTALVSNSGKNHNAAGPVMFNAAAFSTGDKTLDDNETLTITLTLTAADA